MIWRAPFVRPPSREKSSDGGVESQTRKETSAEREQSLIAAGPKDLGVAPGPSEGHSATRPEPTGEDTEMLSEMSAQLWAAGASLEDAAFIAKMLWRNGFAITKREEPEAISELEDVKARLKTAIDVFEGMNDDEITEDLLPHLREGLRPTGIIRSNYFRIGRHGR
jgi:hypothetical protein